MCVPVRSQCKMGSPELLEFAAERMQNLYARPSSALGHCLSR
jgi:hypothetical protein